MFRKAERKKARLRLGVCGPSGSGKTWSALEIASGMGGKIAMIDTEAGRGELYGEDFEYDVVRIDAPYSPDKYIAVIKEAEKSGYDTLIIDSLSHAWVGEGGVLSIVERAGGTYQQGWKAGTPKQNALIDAIITSKLHIIVTMRSKTEYVVEINEKGKHAPRKVGTAPVQRDGLEYEFTLFMDMNCDHLAHVTKDNTKLFDQEYIKPTKNMGEKLIEWLNSGRDAFAEEAKQLEECISKITTAKTLEELKVAFDESKLSDLRHNEKIFSEVIKAKDDRKDELLMKTAMNEVA